MSNDGNNTAGEDEFPRPASGPMDKPTADWYVQHTDGQFQAFQRDRKWYLHPRASLPRAGTGKAEGPMSPVVLILTHPADVHADAVQAHLDTAGVEVRRIDTAALGALATPVTAHFRDGALTGDVAGASLARVVGVWHRRPSEFAVADEADRAELQAGVGGILAGLPYLNHPADMAVAGLKPYQLTAAGRSGLLVPETMISTVRPVASAMSIRLGGAVVVKPISRLIAGLVDENDRSGWERAIHLTQQRIATTRHVRLTVLDGTMFAALIESPHLDWRREPEACRYHAVDTPNEVAGPVRHLMALLRLRYAALDFAVDGHGRWWFLEVNPNGQWLWIEHATGLPIAAAVATALQVTGPCPQPMSATAPRAHLTTVHEPLDDPGLVPQGHPMHSTNGTGAANPGAQPATTTDC
ncbi:hypothetical protein [Rugosimonospora africana]|nr:hypothetical protein [Rugosimonospora africana]